MIRPFALAALLAAFLGVSVPAQAFPGGWAQQRQQQGQRERQYQVPQRDFERAERERPQRMTPDERRQLRRDLHDANRDLRPQRRDRR